jgi:beta-lactamase regulating signal transducer with metallopeptidase domain/protein involved in polysaccharide export with SLBB domain
MTLVDIAAALVRTTLATSLAALVAWGLLAALRVRSPRIHRTAWLLVIAQGWLFFPFTIEIESAEPTPRRAAGLVPAVIAEVETEAIPFENETQRRRGPFATSDSRIVENQPSHKVPDPLPLAIAAWFLGAITLVVIAAYRYVQVLCTLPIGSPPDDPQWQVEWETAHRSAKLRRHQTVTLRITAALGPLLHWAPRAYFILVPRPLWSSLESAERTAILRHELAHLRRNDLWKSLAIRVLALPQWFNPLAWLAVRRFDEAAEWACDDAAAPSANDRLAFANSLLQSAEYALAPYPASAPAARGTLTRRIHRLVSPRFKEESKMKLLLVPMLLLLAAVAQTIRIERVVAELPQQPPNSHRWSLAEEFSVPLAQRLENTKRWHAQLLAERQRAVDAAESSNNAATQDGRHSGPPASIEQMNFDQLAKEFEQFAHMNYVIEPPDILSIRVTPRLSNAVRGNGPIANVGPPRLKVAVAPSGATKRFLVEMDGRISLKPYASVYVAGMTLDEAKHAIQVALDSRGIENDVQVSVDQFNSKVYYVITEGAAEGDDVTRLPIPYPVDGKETVGAAIARVYGDPEDLANPKGLIANATITLHRVAFKHPGASRIYAIEWDPALQAPTPLTNHCLLPGDRIFIHSKESVERRAIRRAQAAPLPPEEVNPQKLPRDGDYYKPERTGTQQSTYRLQPYDTIKLHVARPHRPAYTLTWGDIEGEFTLSRDGSIYLGDDLGLAQLAGMTSAEACTVIERQLRDVAPQCKATLEFGTLASEKFFVSIQRPDGTEVAAGAMPVDVSAPASMYLGSLRHWLGTAFEEADWELAEPSDSSGRKAYLPGPGDRLVIKVRADGELGLLESPPSRPNYRVIVPPPMWIEVFGKKARMFNRAPFPGWRALYSTQFDHPDVQIPAGPKYSR